MDDDLVYALHSKAIERATEDDKRWFELNPHRMYRIRDPFPMEMNGPIAKSPKGYSTRIVVAKIHSEVRMRNTIGVLEQVPNEGASDANLEKLLRDNMPEALAMIEKARRAVRDQGL
ncbi:hypothetical protein V7S57_08455 [Caulobacter sp. CCNWLY153]|uniref:hypothetical protein n=1 Tax=Caulobacter TaxID=75 RepID=UPI0010583A23|nr:hypothetical protein [Caulobacter radicis]